MVGCHLFDASDEFFHFNITSDLSGHIKNDNLRIVVVDTKLSAKTDSNGRYEIILGKNSVPKSSLIKVESLRFEGSVKVNLSSSKQAN